MIAAVPKLPPLSAIRLQPSVRRALLLPCVDPSLRGVVLLGARGTGKSLMLGAFSEFLSRISALAGDDFLPPSRSLPLACDRDRLLGGLDFAATLRSGDLCHQPGLLSGAAPRWLFAESLGLGERQNLALVKTWLDRTPGAALFAAITEGEDDSRAGWAHLIDAIPLHLPMAEGASSDTRQEVIASDLRWAEPEALLQLHESFGAATERAVHGLIAARARLAKISIDEEARNRIVRSSKELGVLSPRADIFAMIAARAHAALLGHDGIEDEDFEFAVNHVLAPRGRDPMQASASPSRNHSLDTTDEQRASEPKDPHPQAGKGTEASKPDQELPPSDSPPGPAAELPEEVLAPKPWIPSEGDSTPWDGFSAANLPMGGPSGGRSLQATLDRGRHFRSRPGHVRGRRLAVAETIRRAAARHGRHGGHQAAFRVIEEDLAWRTLRSRAGHLFLIAVDASGSMAWHRMREAKGLALELLRDAYRHRDAVAVIAFRNEQAELLLPPTSAQDRARRALERLPTGGGTPIASALVMLQKLANEEQSRLQRPTFALLLTDGRANVPLAGKSKNGRELAQRELPRLCRQYAASGPKTLVVNTSPKARANSDAEKLARMLSTRAVSL